MGLFGKSRVLQPLEKRMETLQGSITELGGTLAQMRGERSTLQLEQRVEELSRQKLEAEIALEELREQHGREQREIDHKLGLHRRQVESEREIMIKEAEAERLRSVEQAKLAVREENLEAERRRFDQEIEFRTKRFEEEAATLRGLTEQILSRLPTVTVDRQFRTVETIGPRALEAGGGEED